MTSGVSKEEIYTLAKLENISTEEYEKLHIEEDNFDKRKYLKTIPCRYLEEKLCSIYPHRPEECRSYPHTQKKHFLSRTLMMNSNYGICPIIYNLIENMKFELKFHG